MERLIEAKSVTTKPINNYRNIYNYVMVGFLIGCIFPFLTMMYLLFHPERFTLTEILKLQSVNPFLWSVEIFPFVIAFLAFIVGKRIDNLKEIYQEKFIVLDETIQRNAKLATMIGRKEFTEILNVKDDDELGKALLLMRKNLLETSEKEDELNWIARGKDLISNILRQHNIIEVLAYETLVNLIKYIDAVQGSFYIYDEEKERIVNTATYAYNRKKYVNQELKLGDGLIGQVAYELDIIYRREIPDDYVTITSGILGDKKPKTLLIVPLISDEKLQGILEFAFLLDELPALTVKFVKELSIIIGQTIFNLKVNIRTEKLLRDAQIMTEELRKNEDALRKNAVEMEKTQKELEESNKNLESKIKEVENAQKRLHSLLENASEIISIFDENELVKYESPSVKHILGYDPEDVIGKNTFEEVHKLATVKLKGIFAKLLESPEEPQTVEFQYKRTDGEVLWLETTGRNLISNPAINGVIFNTRDITVRKIAERAQRMSGQMQALSENSPDMIVRLGPQGKFYYVNPIVEQFTGVITNNIINRTLLEVSIDTRITTFFSELLDKVKSTRQKYEIETMFPAISGERIMLVNAIPEMNDEIEIESILFVSHDITERKNIEKEIIEKNKNINDSINYAQRIQTSLLPDTKKVRDALPDSFIYFKPKDVISGDFPWFCTKGDDIYIAAIDCTGHGVPGALLSFVAYFLLNNIVDRVIDYTSGQLLDEFHSEVRRTLKQDRVEANARDGMDIALCKINFVKKELQFSGAHRPLYYLKNRQLSQYRGDQKSIGGIPDKRKEEKNFETNVVHFDVGDKCFFFSDGITDQIGGQKDRKYQASRIRDIIIEHADFTIDEFSRYFPKDFNEWKGENKQIDDVLLIGIEF